MDLFIYALKTYTNATRTGQYNMENKAKDGLYSPSPNKNEDIYVLELRAVHGTFIIQNVHVDKNRNNVPSSPKNFLNPYKSMQYSATYNLSQHSRINWLQSRSGSKRKDNLLDDTFTSYFNFPVPRCSNTGYSKST